MKYIFALLLLMTIPAFAAETKEKKAEPVKEQAKAIDLPEMSFRQGVEIVVTAKKDPRILDLKVDQDKQNILASVIVDKNVDRKEAEEMASTLILLIKTTLLDDQSQKKDVPGKSVYDYQLNYSLPNGVMLLTALKPAKKAKIRFENPIPPARSAIRADEDDQ